MACEKLTDPQITSHSTTRVTRGIAQTLRLPNKVNRRKTMWKFYFYCSIVLVRACIVRKLFFSTPGGDDQIDVWWRCSPPSHPRCDEEVGSDVPSKCLTSEAGLSNECYVTGVGMSSFTFLFPPRRQKRKKIKRQVDLIFFFVSILFSWGISFHRRCVSYFLVLLLHRRTTHLWATSSSGETCVCRWWKRDDIVPENVSLHKRTRLVMMEFIVMGTFARMLS